MPAKENEMLFQPESVLQNLFIHQPANQSCVQSQLCFVTYNRYQFLLLWNAKYYIATVYSWESICARFASVETVMRSTHNTVHDTSTSSKSNNKCRELLKEKDKLSITKRLFVAAVFAFQKSIWAQSDRDSFSFSFSLSPALPRLVWCALHTHGIQKT